MIDLQIKYLYRAFLGFFMAYLQDVRLTVLIQQYIKPQYFKTSVCVIVSGEARVVAMLQHRMRGNYGFNNDLINRGPDGGHVEAPLLKTTTQGGNFTLAPKLIIDYEHPIMLIDRVIG